MVVPLESWAGSVLLTLPDLALQMDRIPSKLDAADRPCIGRRVGISLDTSVQTAAHNDEIEITI